MLKTSIETEVAIVGAGPGGSSLAGFLRLLGHRVTVFEKDVFPRFHIGESLQPMTIPALLELGVDLSQESFALRKPGAVFVDRETNESLRIEFARALDGTFPFAYQVERAHFDHAIARRAAELGTDVRYGSEVESWEEGREDVLLSGAWGACRARILVDATGQQALLGRKNRNVQPLERFGVCASFAMFGGVESQLARALLGQGHIGHLLAPAGWNWLIPLTAKRVSVGLVERAPTPGTTAEGVLMQYIEDSPFLTELLSGAERITPCRRIANYSYYNLVPWTERTVSVGDARAFLDPIFSSGVTLAILSARLLAGEISSALKDARVLELDEYGQRCDIAYTTFDRLIERFYRPDWVRNVFFAAGKDDRLVRELTSILAGDVWRDDNSIQRMLLKSRPRTGFGSEAEVVH